ncbi:hypothetical protein, partial [Acinetobacter baumannii]|uniref:hypothetical protein n=1 Tax=Acinetobacter baumannii TaxID=470 RepID=UPI001C06FFA4
SGSAPSLSHLALKTNFYSPDTLLASDSAFSQCSDAPKWTLFLLCLQRLQFNFPTPTEFCQPTT